MGNVFAQEMQPFELGEQTASRLRRQLLQILLQGISRVVRPGHCRECLSTPLLGNCEVDVGQSPLQSIRRIRTMLLDLFRGPGCPGYEIDDLQCSEHDYLALLNGMRR